MALSYKDLLKKFGDELKLLEIKDKNTPKVLEQNKLRDMKRHLGSIENQLDGLHELRINIEEAKIAVGGKVEDIEHWGAEFDARVKHFEKLTETLTEAISAVNLQAENERAAKEKSEEELCVKKRLEEEKCLEEMRLELREQYELGEHVKDKKPVDSEQSVKVKLPKLSITRFNGSHIDWLRFWNQFSAEIDTAAIAGVSKFFYLKGFLACKVCLLIDGLPFTSEGYEHAKAILQTKYGKPSEIVTAHVKGIMELPTITGTNPQKVHEFFERLTTHVQALETLGQVKSINGYIRLLLDRLPGVQSDLVRSDENCADWEFPHLVEALRRWTERNPVHDEKRDKHLLEWKADKLFHAQKKPISNIGCVYCVDESHRSVEHPKVKSISERKQMLSSKRLRFNCAKGGHRASQCKSQGCMKYKGKHHTSVCDKDTTNGKGSAN